MEGEPARIKCSYLLAFYAGEKKEEEKVGITFFLYFSGAAPVTWAGDVITKETLVVSPEKEYRSIR